MVVDILLDKDGDLYFDENYDIVLNNSVSQKIRIRLLWFLGEWRWDDEMGLPYFEELFIKEPDLQYFEELITEEIFNVDEVTEVENVEILVDDKTRTASIFFVAITDLEAIKEEVEVKFE